MKKPGNLMSRLAELERQRSQRGEKSNSKGALLAKLGDIGERLRGGDLGDIERASPAERVALAFERGDAAFAETLLLKAAGRQNHKGLSQ